MGPSGTGHAASWRAAKRWIVAAAAPLAPAGILVGAVPAAAAPALPAGCAVYSPGTVICSYEFTGTEQVFVVPPRVTQVQVAALAAPGAASALMPTGLAGQGAKVFGTLNVTSNERLFVEVGGAPTTSTGVCASANDPCVGGFNGGGNGGDSGGGGGGASDIRTVSTAQPAATSLASRMVVAGGGGGSGQAGSCSGSAGGAGADAGVLANGFGSAGGPSGTCSDDVNDSGGGGANLSAGGNGGVNSTSAPAASVGQAGSPTAATQGNGGSNLSGGGGGGGGGFFGGGSGAGVAGDQGATGGGSGSSLIPAGGAVRDGNQAAGSVRISYAQPSSLADLADLAVRIAGKLAQVSGARFTEKITVTNYGPDAAAYLTTVLGLPRYLRVVSAPHSSRHGGQLRWADPLLVTGGSVSYMVTFRATSDVVATVSLRSTVTADGSIDPNGANNTATVSIRLGG